MFRLRDQLPYPPFPRRRRVRVSKRSGEKLSDDGTEFYPSPSAQPRPAPSPFPAHPTRTQAFPCPGHFREQRRLSTHLREIDQPSSPLPLPVCPGRKKYCFACYAHRKRTTPTVYNSSVSYPIGRRYISFFSSFLIQREGDTPTTTRQRRGEGRRREKEKKKKRKGWKGKQNERWRGREEREGEEGGQDGREDGGGGQRAAVAVLAENSSLKKIQAITSGSSSVARTKEEGGEGVHGVGGKGGCVGGARRRKGAKTLLRRSGGWEQG